MLDLIFLWWVIFLILFLPLPWVGWVLIRKATSLERLELTLPIGTILGLAVFVFVLNLVSFVFKGGIGITVSYLATIFLGIFLGKIHTLKSSPVDFLHKKSLIFWLITIGSWAGLIIWKVRHTLIGSDANLYYAVAHTFLKGNSPPMTPWQPDLPLSYHLGTFQLLGAFHFLTNFSFEFLHLTFASIFIFCISQIVIWIWGRHKGLFSLIFANLLAALVLISFGFVKIAIPIFPLQFLKGDFHKFLLWIRGLPTVGQAIEVYGAPVSLDSLIYFIFHAFGLGLFFSLVTLIIYPKTKNTYVTWAVLFISLAVLALINESIFIIATPACIMGILLKEKELNNLKKNLRNLLLLFLIFTLTVLFQGGIISNTLFQTSNLEKSVLLFPNKDDIREDFNAYHYNQQISKALPYHQEWLPFAWFHIGADLLLLISFVLVVNLKTTPEKRLLIFTLFLAGLFSLIAYNVVVPKFLVANGNRLLIFSFIFLALSAGFSLFNIYEKFFQGSLIKKALAIFLISWLFIPTVLPPFLKLSKTRSLQTKFFPHMTQSTEGIKWIKVNLPYNKRVMVLDIRAPHPSGVARVLTEAGVFSPIFPGNFRAYTIEASPEYIDIAYFLSPKALQILGIKVLLVDSHFYQTLPEIRKFQLNDDKYFKLLFSKVYPDKSWEKIFEIKPAYFKEQELLGTLRELVEKIPQNSKVYIDQEENFTYNFLRRPIIFSLRDRDLYFLPQSGVYLNVEVEIPFSLPKKDIIYDYLVLSKKTDPKTVCSCDPKLLWQGLKGEVLVWHTFKI